MQISKVPPAEVPTVRTGTAAMTGQDLPAAADIAPTADRADIRPLDVSAALQILLAEVRAGLGLAADAPVAQGPAGAPVAQGPAGAFGPVQTVRALVEMFLQALPDDASDPPAWTAALLHVETSIQSSIERAISVVTQWRDVPPPALDAVKETRVQYLTVLGDDLQNPLWLRPEWMALRPLFQRFHRRRRNARRRLTDPDYAPGSLDESEDIRP
jgi:hypothetical protein